MTHDRGPALRWSLLVASLFVLQVGVVTDLELFGVHPDLMLLMAICAGLAGGPTRGAVVGFAAGLLSDLLLSGALGVTALAFALVGFGVGAAAQALIHSTRLISLGLTAVASIAGVLLYAAIAQLLGQRTLSDPRLWTIVGIVSVFNVALCLPVLGLGRWAEGSGPRSGLG